MVPNRKSVACMLALIMLLLTIPALVHGKLRRWQGAALLGIYAVFCFIQFVVI